MHDSDTLHYYDLPDQLPDLRAGLEALKDRVLTHAGGLEAEQRALLTAILEQGSSYRQVARLRGEHAATVSRRFRRLLRKLSHRTGTPGVKAGRLAPLDTTILSSYYLFGMNQSQIAAKLGVSRYRVRKALEQFATSTAKHPSSLPELRRTESLTVPPIAQNRRRPCTR